MMKKYLCILIMMGISLCMMAQKELRINEVFSGKMISSKNVTETLIQGKSLESCKLDKLHTIKLNATEHERNDIEKLFKADIKDATGINDDVVESRNNYIRNNDNMELEIRNGHIYYAVVQLQDFRGKHRFVCYQCKKTGDEYKITLAYMRGEASMNELRKMFKK